MLYVDVKVKICEGEPVFGPGIVKLIQNIKQSGSMKEACAAMDMSYSKGWKIINRAEAHLGFPIINRQHGGNRGGRCTVTEQGESYLQKYLSMEKEVSEYAVSAFEKHFL